MSRTDPRRAATGGVTGGRSRVGTTLPPPPDPATPLRQGYTLHVNVICEAPGCGLDLEGYTSANQNTAERVRRQGIRHARTTGHAVRIESARTDIYNMQRA